MAASLASLRSELAGAQQALGDAEARAAESDSRCQQLCGKVVCPRPPLATELGALCLGRVRPLAMERAAEP